MVIPQRSRRQCCAARWPVFESAAGVSENLERSTDAGSLERAIAAGDLDFCRTELEREALSTGQRAVLYCRLDEAFYYRGQYADAVECARAAFDLQTDCEAVADCCAWLFSNCGQHLEAAAAYERLIECRPGWAAGHRHASGSFAVAGDLDRAIQHAARASELDPASVEFAVHAGALLTNAGLHRDAFNYFARAVGIAPDDPDVLRRLSDSAFAIGDRECALDLALRAYALMPGERAHAHHATELLLRSDRLDEAAELMAASLAADETDAVGYRLLSAAEMLRGRPEPALDAIDSALAITPDVSEYYLHRGNLLYRLARFDEAADAFRRAAAIDPENPAAKRSQLTVYFDAGKFREAVAVGGELIQIEPDNEEYAQAVLQVLNRRFETLEGDYIVIGDRPAGPPRTPRPQPGLWSAAQTQWRVICALIIRETRTRFGDSTLGYGWALLEPILHILMLSLVFAVLMHGRPPIGTQFFIFYYTGIVPYHVFVHSSTSMTNAVTANGPLLQLPDVDPFDVILARGLLELVTDILVAAMLLAGFGAIGLATLPTNFNGVAAATAAIWLLGCGCGFINAVINAFCKSWDKIWAQLTRILYFCSGIFYVPGMMPDWIRDLLAWNPVLHAVDWFRASFFADYVPHWLDRSYLVMVAGTVLLAGLALERGLRRRLYEPS
jgi:ABC-type polysaccharide/polyol phosphate export permease/tetratricopeptide (TPR) repeat protein